MRWNTISVMGNYQEMCAIMISEIVRVRIVFVVVVVLCLLANLVGGSKGEVFALCSLR